MIVIIPARMNSTRLPKKLIRDLHGKSVINRTYDNVMNASPSKVFIAVDSNEMAKHCQSFGAETIMTLSSHNSGTERLAEAVDKANLDNNEIIINVQGDEPFLPSNYIKQCYQTLKDSQCKIATLACQSRVANYENNTKSSVKVVINKFQHAMYFSRSPIPCFRDEPKGADLQLLHLGIYAYEAEFLKQSIKLEQPLIEHAEKLEQLKLLWHGHNIKVGIVDKLPVKGIDEEADLVRAREYLNCLR